MGLLGELIELEELSLGRDSLESESASRRTEWCSDSEV